MKRLVLCSIAMISVTLLLAQTPSTGVQQTAEPGFRRASAVSLGAEETITAEAMIPPSGVFQKKTDTPVKPVYYRFNRNVVRETNRLLLNKWLKESK
ncbi:MAG: hypothetical protein U1C33_05100 [Candidatus Cloacimonadaceae bacterium]|nr:hypothetical protein [Candidatus Cloacimonadaceae bacterium]